MASQLNNIKIALRKDDLTNWTSANPILKNGELAIVVDSSGNEHLKIGNGLSTFNQLPYTYESKFETDDFTSKSIAQGIKASARPLGLAAGAYLSALADFSQVMGYNAKSIISDQYSFVWNGDSTMALGQYGGTYYQSHGEGTFSVNPKNGLSGFYIGDQNLANAVQSIEPNALSTKSAVYVTDPVYSEISNKTDLNIMKLTQHEYDQLVVTSSILSDTIYIISSDTIDAFGQQVKNVADPTDLSDAVTLGYAEQHFISSHQSLDNYYTKSETSSSSQLDGALSKKADSATTIAGYGITDAKIDGTKITLGNTTITALTAVPSDYKTYQSTLNQLSADGYVMTALLNMLSSQLSSAIQSKITLNIYDD